MKNKKPVNKYNKYGVVAVLFLALLILIVNIVSASYSWFLPGNQNGSGMQFVQDDYIRSESCSFTLHEGSVAANGVLTFPKEIKHDGTASATMATDTTVSVTSADDVTDVRYYQIIVQNADTENASDISLYLTGSIPADTTLGVTKPTNSCHTYGTAQTEINIVRNAYVKKLSTTDVDPGILYVEFYLKCTSDSFAFDERNIVLMYN